MVRTMFHRIRNGLVRALSPDLAPRWLKPKVFPTKWERHSTSAVAWALLSRRSMGQGSSCCQEEPLEIPKEVVLHKYDEPSAEEPDTMKAAPR